MDIPSFTPKLPVIPDAEQTPRVRSLLQLIAQQQEHIQRLEDEIRRMKGGPRRPQLKPSSLESAGIQESGGANVSQTGPLVLGVPQRSGIGSEDDTASR